MKARAVSIGTFDGVHRGHQVVVSTLRDIALQRGLKPTVITFDRHPLEIIAPDKAPGRIMPLSEEIDLLRSLGVDVMVQPFTEETRRLSAAQWLRHLRQDLATGALVMGYDNTFGCDCRSLSSDGYIALGAEEDIPVVVAPEVAGISSSAIRKAIAEGAVAEAGEMLGRPYSISGPVVGGKQLGRRIGFPTANVEAAQGLVLPASGVYAARAVLPQGEKLNAVVNIGTRPTVDNSGLISIEAHIPGWEGNLYGSQLRVEFIDRIRSEQRFASIEELKEKLAADVAAAASIFRSYTASPQP